MIEVGARNWAPRVGWEAGRLRSAADVANMFASGLLLVFFGVYAAALATKSGIVIGLCIAAGAAMIGMWVRSIQLRNRYHRAATRHLGVPVNWRVNGYIPRDTGRYEQWCRAHGLTPNAAATDSPEQTSPDG
jgi:hypothetical protein